MNSNLENKLQMINELVNSLNNDINKYNQFILPIQRVQSELAKHKSEDVIQLNNQLSDLRKNLETTQVKTLQEKIKNKTIEIEKLDIEIFGKSDSDSPSFLMPRKI